MLKKKFILVSGRVVQAAACYLVQNHYCVTYIWKVDYWTQSPALLLNQDDVIVKIRYRKQANRCTVTLQPDNTLHVQLHEPLTAIASGQAAAFYRGDVVLGGGIIWR